MTVKLSLFGFAGRGESKATDRCTTFVARGGIPREHIRKETFAVKQSVAHAIHPPWLPFVVFSACENRYYVPYHSHSPSFDETNHCACSLTHARFVALEADWGFLLMGCHFWSYLNALKILARRRITSSKSFGSITFTNSHACFHLSLFVKSHLPIRMHASICLCS